jgi:phenylacetate-CoA ligase
MRPRAWTFWPNWDNEANMPLSTRDALLKRQREELRNLLRFVWPRSSFYREYYARHGIAERDLAELDVGDLPFVSKAMLMENFDAAVTEPELRKKDLEQWLQENRDPRQLYRGKYIVVHSSGSSGDPAVFVSDAREWRLTGMLLANHLPPPERGPRDRTRVAATMASHGHFGGVTSVVRLPQSVFEVLVLSVLDAASRVVERLNAFQPDRLVGYSSSLAMLAESALAGDLRISPGTIIASGDMLTGKMEAKIQSAWPARVYDVYAASEARCLAVRAPGEEEMTTMDELNILEILDRESRAVASGAAGRVVLTNLHHAILPILRYELGDHAIAGKGRQDSVFGTIRSIQGRAAEALPVTLDDGTRDSIHPIVLAEFFAADLETIQFISEQPDRVEIRYVAARDIDDRVRREFSRILELKAALTTTFAVRRVESIPVDPRTGKSALVRIGEEPQGLGSTR